MVGVRIVNHVHIARGMQDLGLATRGCVVWAGGGGGGGGQQWCSGWTMVGGDIDVRWTCHKERRGCWPWWSWLILLLVQLVSAGSPNTTDQIGRVGGSQRMRESQIICCRSAGSGVATVWC